mmetsp:Transcript_65818/g.174515  ORF Transcript_65818/g.174515 Transcript_65818/m.174515 type:complete len:92 (+) Transcript_65818:1213-1488(+)
MLCGSKGTLASDGVTGRSVQGHIKHAEHVYTRFCASSSRTLHLQPYRCLLSCLPSPACLLVDSLRQVRFTSVQYSFFNWATAVRAKAFRIE